MRKWGDRGDTIVSGGLLAIALLFGGGSLLFPFYRLIVEFAAVLALAWFAWRPWRWPEGWSARILAALAACVVLLLLVQLVPLEASMWKGLPGRQLAAAVRTAAGGGEVSEPLSLNPAGTRDTLAYFLVPVAMLVAALRIGADGRRKLIWLAAGFGVLNGALVVLQFQGFSSLTFYVTGDVTGTGLFANKNHSAVFLAAIMPALAWTIMQGWQAAPISTRRWVATASVGFVALTVFGCLSRAGLGLMVVGLGASAMILAPAQLDRRGRLIVFGSLGMLALLLAVVLPQTAVVSRAIERFDAGDDLRYHFWPVVVSMIKTYFPAGSGFGTFQQVFAAAEPLAIIQPNYINHAHSDYMEIVLEGGLAGAMLIVGFLAWFAVTAAKRLWACRWGRAGFPPVAIAVAGMSELLLHSVLDYPLRTLALATLAALYCATLAAEPSALDLQEPKRYRKHARRRTGRLHSA